MSNFDKAFELLLEHEGGYSNNLYDPGGRTMFGITEDVARVNGYTGDMKNLPIEVAKDIYQGKYWNPYFDKIPFSIAFNVFDAGVNSGIKASIKWLQEVVNVEQDGIFGYKTYLAVSYRDEYSVVCKYNSKRLLFLTNLKTWGVFGKGWSRRIARNLDV